MRRLATVTPLLPGTALAGLAHALPVSDGEVDAPRMRVLLQLEVW